MKVQLGNVQARAVIEQFARWLPGRADQIRKLGEKCQIGLQIELSPMKRAHSQSQRGAYWASLHEFGRALGYSAHETESLLHPVICTQAFGSAGHKEITCRGQTYSWPVPAETSSKTAEGQVRDVETYGILMEALQQFAAEYGHVINFGDAA